MGSESQGEGSSSALKMKPRRLRGHKAAATCCIASRTQTGLVASSGEDGCVCLFDLRCKDVLFNVVVGQNPVSSLCFRRGNENIIYASSGTEVQGFDIRMPSSWKPLETYNYNKEEINQIVFSHKSSFLAAADDSGEVKVIDVQQQCLYKTLRAVHTSICSSVQFLSWKPWSVITGGLDSKLAIWDFSKGHSVNAIDYGLLNSDKHSTSNGSGQLLNPPFIHGIAIPEADLLELNKFCAVARGDGVVDVMDTESELCSGKSSSSTKQGRGSLPKSKSTALPNKGLCNQQKRLQFDCSLGGHNAAVSCVCFSVFGEKGRFIISGGNDAFVKMWDWSRYFDVEQHSSGSAIHLNIDVRKKVNWLCTTPADSENLIVCDTSKVVKVYTLS